MKNLSKTTRVKTLKGILHGSYNKKKSRTKFQIYKDLIRSIHYRYIYKMKYTTKEKFLLLSELNNQLKTNQITTTSLRKLEKQYNL